MAWNFQVTESASKRGDISGNGIVVDVPWHSVFIWFVALASIALVLIRPKGLPEAWWAMLGAIVLVLFRLITPGVAMQAIKRGIDVYLFLIGMMIMSEMARREGVFDWVAGHAVHASGGSRKRLFVLIYCVGTVVTIFLSNDATAVVLTPAVLAAIRAAEAEPLPYLLICAFIANAASFVLPISNPANLVVYGRSLPALAPWLATFALPSVASIAATFVVLRRLSARYLEGPVNTNVDGQPLSTTGRMTLFGIAFLAIVLMVASAFKFDLGVPACVSGLLVAAMVSLRDQRTPRA
ncbi:MAG: anion permease, partial [Acidobacteriaceae bacterium]|nr:anion permease [Acidobacteriaceae bacterium]